MGAKTMGTSPDCKKGPTWKGRTSNTCMQRASAVSLPACCHVYCLPEWPILLSGRQVRMTIVPQPHDRRQGALRAGSLHVLQGLTHWTTLMHCDSYAHRCGGG